MKSKTAFLNVSENARMAILVSLIALGISSKYVGEEGSLAHLGPTFGVALDTVFGEKVPTPPNECAGNFQKNCLTP